MTETAPVRRTYGSWRAARGFGIGSWSAGQTGTAFVAVLIPILLFYVSPVAGLVALGISALVLAVVLIPVDGQTLWGFTARRVRFATARRSGWTEVSGGVLTDHPRKNDLPGPAAPLVPLDVDDGRGGRQAMLWDRRNGHLTVVLRCAPVGLSLADQEQADQWVACWAAWLADLGFQPMLRWIAVTVDTAPTGGATIRDHVQSRRNAASPPLAQTIMGELVASTPGTTADVDTRVSLTFDPSRSHARPKDLLAAVAEVARWIPGLEQGLAACGVTVLGRASVPWLVARLRVAFDPESRGEVALLDDRQQVVEWRDAAPVRATETWESWRHDSGVSVSWAMREAPRAAVTERVLTPLLAPGPHPRRVTLLYTPFPSEQAAEEVEQEITNLAVRAEWARRTRRDATRRDVDDQRRAESAAREESQGAGVGRFVVYVTTTVIDGEGDGEALASAVADTELRARQAKLRLRRLRGAQLAGFVGALGLGVNLAELEGRYGR